MLSRRVMNRLSVLSACVFLWTVTCVAGPSERWVHAVEFAAAGTEASAPAPSEQRAAVERTAPEKAYQLLDALQRRNGEPLPGYVGGKIFQNRERRLPVGRYKEYDVNRRVPGRSRGAERLVIEQDTGRAYYTNDHYRTFLPLN
jgi:ribonuclease T1